MNSKNKYQNMKITTSELLKRFDINGNNWSYINENPCIIDFYAEWCNPCKNLAKTLDIVSNEYEIEILKVDIEEEYELANIFSIKSLPTLIFCSKENKPIISTGAIPKNKIEEHLKNIISEEVYA